MLQLFAGSFFPSWVAVLTHNAVNQWKRNFHSDSTFHSAVLATVPSAPAQEHDARPGQSAWRRTLSFLSSGPWEGTQPAHRVKRRRRFPSGLIKPTALPLRHLAREAPAVGRVLTEKGV